MEQNNIWKVYNKHAKYYDLIFGKILDNGREKAIKIMDLKEDQKIVEIGIGTGLSLKHYANCISLKITGIDLSTEMLKKAKLQSKKYQNLDVSLKKIDGENTKFEDNTFDKVVLMYVYSVTPNPEKLMHEAIRICKNDGQIYIINHFSHSNNDKPTFAENLLSSFSHKIGFRSNFSYKKHIENLGIKVNHIESANAFSITKIISINKNKNLHLINPN